MTKSEAKDAMRSQLGMELNPKKALIGVFLDYPLTSKQAEMIQGVIPAVQAVGIQLAIIADDKSLSSFENSSFAIPLTRKNRKLMLDATDISICLPFNDVEEMQLHGIVPVSSPRKEIIDYNPNSETGNAFIFHREDTWNLFATLVRALETFKFPYDWKHIVKRGVERDHHLV